MALSNIGHVDSVLHELIEENGSKEKERILFPFTRYDNILNRPKYLKLGEKIEKSNNPDFLLVATETEEVNDTEIYTLFNQTW